MGKKRKPVARHGHRIESGSIGEEEYETLYKQHFENLTLDAKGKYGWEEKCYFVKLFTNHTT